MRQELRTFLQQKPLFQCPNPVFEFLKMVHAKHVRIILWKLCNEPSYHTVEIVNIGQTYM